MAPAPTRTRARGGGDDLVDAQATKIPVILRHAYAPQQRSVLRSLDPALDGKLRSRYPPTRSEPIPMPPLLYRPLGDGRVDFRHEADGFAQGRDDLAVVLQVRIVHGAATGV